MGFKLKKKNPGEETVRKASGSGFFAKLQARTEEFASVFGETEKSKPLIFRCSFLYHLIAFPVAISFL